MITYCDQDWLSLSFLVGGAFGEESPSDDKYFGFIRTLELIFGFRLEDICPKGGRFVLIVPRGTRLEEDENVCLFRTFCSIGGKFSRQTIIGSSSTSSMFGFFEIWKMLLRSDEVGKRAQGEFDDPAGLLVNRKHSEKSWKRIRIGLKKLERGQRFYDDNMEGFKIIRIQVTSLTDPNEVSTLWNSRLQIN